MVRAWRFSVKAIQIGAYIIAAISLLYLPRCYLLEKVDQFTQIVPGMTQEEVRQILGEPHLVYPPEAIARAWIGRRPTVTARGEIWVYDVPYFPVRRLVVHFNEEKRVDFIVVGST